jgi:hypothetical protein
LGLIPAGYMLWFYYGKKLLAIDKFTQNIEFTGYIGTELGVQFSS